MTSNLSAPPTKTTASAGPRRRRAGLALLAIFGLVAAGCSSGPGSREDMIEVITLDGAFTEAEAVCITDAVFDRYGDDEDALGKISAADSFEFFDSEDGVPGFSDFYDDTVRGCAAIGPTSG